MRCVVCVVLGLSPSAALAADVNFSGTVVSICSILAATDGHLVLNSNGNTLTSELSAGGLPGTVTILAIGTNTIEVSEPELTDSPQDYDPTHQVVEVAYFGVDGLSAVLQPFTDQATDFQPASIAASELTINNR